MEADTFVFEAAWEVVNKGKGIHIHTTAGPFVFTYRVVSLLSSWVLLFQLSVVVVVVVGVGVK